MKAKFACPVCGQKITVSAATMGKRGKCPGCGQAIAVPTAAEFKSAAAARGSAPKVPGPDAPPEKNNLESLFADEPLDDLFGEAVEDAAMAPASKTLAPPPKTKANNARAKPPRTRTWRGFAGMVFGVVLLLATIPASIGAFVVAGQMSASKGWPSTDGTVYASHVSRVRVGKKVKYRADVRYEYHPNGGLETGSRIRFGDTTGNSESAQQALADRYPVGAKVTVYYDPSSPRQSVLEPGGWPIMMAIPPVVLAVIGGLFFGVSTGRLKS